MLEEEKPLYRWSRTGNKMIIDSGYRTFDKYVSCISHGNALSKGQVSFYIRPRNEIECNGSVYERGYLQDYDLNMFIGLEHRVREYVKKIAIDKSCILYKFYTYRGNEENLVGYIVEQDGEFKMFVDDYGNRRKKEQCLEFVAKILEKKASRFL